MLRETPLSQVDLFLEAIDQVARKRTDPTIFRTKKIIIVRPSFNFLDLYPGPARELDANSLFASCFLDRATNTDKKFVRHVFRKIFGSSRNCSTRRTIWGRQLIFPNSSETNVGPNSSELEISISCLQVVYCI